jgi:hypothetical protein
MSEDRRLPIERHLTEEELAEAIDEVEQADQPGSSACSVLSRTSTRVIHLKKPPLASVCHSRRVVAGHASE